MTPAQKGYDLGIKVGWSERQKLARQCADLRDELADAAKSLGESKALGEIWSSDRDELAALLDEHAPAAYAEWASRWDE